MVYLFKIDKLCYIAINSTSFIGHYQSIIELPEEVLEEVDKYPFLDYNLLCYSIREKLYS